jgi:uncharacterized membrane protein YoaK (UPF0700 family)
MTAAAKLLTFVLSVVAGSTDVIGFLGLGSLFMAHITGNLVVLAARLFVGGPAPVARLLSVPVFIAVLMLTRLFASGLECAGTASLQPLLLLQSLLLFCFVAICMLTGPSAGPETMPLVVAGMLGVSAMAIQNALVRISLTETPSTAVMTTNVTVFTMDLGEILLKLDTRGASVLRKCHGAFRPLLTADRRRSLSVLRGAPGEISVLLERWRAALVLVALRRHR